jgi:phosphate transport system permease protein
MTELLERPVSQPRELDPGLDTPERIFRLGVKSIGATVLLITGGIATFLGYQAIPTLRHYGFSFFTETQFDPGQNKVGIAAVVVGTFQIAFVAMAIAFPLALCTALYITEIAPPRVRAVLVSLVDLMAAVPSIVWGLWGFFLIEPNALFVAHWLHTYLGWIPIFDVDTNPHAAFLAKTKYTASAFIAGIAVAMMVLPMACAVMREVFSQTPQGEREAALGLGATPWGVIRTVVLPFGRGGIIGGSMLALGRALGETIAVYIIISPAFHIKWSVLQVGSNTVSSLIATRVGDATSFQLSALLCAGFVLFLLTLLVNTIAATVINRSRSGAGTD